MALYTWKFTIPANTPKDNAERMEVWVKRGVVVRAKIVIPTGHVGLAKMQIWKGEIPILPENPDGWIFGDGEEVEDIPLWIIGEKEEINKDMLGELAKDKKRAKKIIDSYDFFLCEAPLMPIVGKTIGRFLGPRGKMPKPIPPNADKTKFVELAKKSVRIRVKDSPVIHTVVGTENMSDDELKDNIEFLVRKIQETLPKGRAQIKDILLKLTMSKPIKIEVK